MPSRKPATHRWQLRTAKIEYVAGRCLGRHGYLKGRRESTPTLFFFDARLAYINRGTEAQTGWSIGVPVCGLTLPL